jgi:hypothetical protein
MAEFNIRTDSVDVEQIMRQIRARIKEKRGVDYTEQQIQELANVKLERFLDPKGVRSDLVEQFKRTRGTSPEPPNYGFEDSTIYETHRGILRFIRRLLNPILKLFFNPNPIAHVLHMQGQINNINTQQFRVREELDALYYEVIHNLVLEVTRLGIESKNLKMRLESLSSRMDFDERRARALEGVVQYRSGTGPAREPQQPKHTADRARQPHAQTRPPAQDRQRQPAAAQPQPLSAGPVEQAGETAAAETPETATPLTPIARGRRGGRGRGLAETAATTGAASDALSADQSATPPHGDPTREAALDQDESEAPLDADSDSTAGADEGPDPEAQ